MGDVVTLAPDAEDEEQQLDGSEAAGGPPLGMVQALWQSSSGAAARPAPAPLCPAKKEPLRCSESHQEGLSFAKRHISNLQLAIKDTEEAAVDCGTDGNSMAHLRLAKRMHAFEGGR